MAYRNYGPNAGYVVAKDGTGDFLTIGAGLTAAASLGGSGTLYIKDGTYTENPNLLAGWNLVTWDADALTPNVIIDGDCTFSGAGTVSISGIQLKNSSGGYFLEVTGSSASKVNIKNCNLISIANGINFTSSSASSYISLINCQGDESGGLDPSFFVHSSAGTLYFKYCNITNSGNSFTASSISSGNLKCEFSSIYFEILTASTASIYLKNCNFDTSAFPITSFSLGGSGTQIIESCLITSGNSNSINIADGTILTLTNSTINSLSSDTFAILGAGPGNGILYFSDINFIGSATQMSVITAHPLSVRPGLLLDSTGSSGTTSQVPVSTASSEFTWGTAPVAAGGSGITSATAYGVICGGTTTTGAFQVITPDASTTKVFTSGGSSSLPTWNPTSGVGNLVLIQTQTASNSASLVFTTGITSIYNNYLFVISDYQAATTGTNLELNISNNGGLSYSITNYFGGTTTFVGGSTILSGTGAITTYVSIFKTIGNTRPNAAILLYCSDITNGNASSYSGYGVQSIGTSSSNGVLSIGQQTDITNINAFQFISSSGNLLTGNFTLYGILE